MPDLWPGGFDAPPVMAVGVHQGQVVARVAFYGSGGTRVIRGQRREHLLAGVFGQGLVQGVACAGGPQQARIAQTVQQGAAFLWFRRIRRVRRQHGQRRVLVEVGGLRGQHTEGIPARVVHPFVARCYRRPQRAFRAGWQMLETCGESVQLRQGLADTAGMAASAFCRQRAAHQRQRQGQAAGHFRQLAGGIGFQGHGLRRQRAQQGQAFLQEQFLHVGDGGGADKGTGQRGLPRGEQARTAGRVHLAEDGQRRPVPGVVEDQERGLAAARQRGSNGMGQGARLGIGGHVHVQGVRPQAQHGVGGLGLGRIGAQIAPEDAAAKVHEHVGIVGQRRRERRLAHAGQAVHGGKGGSQAGRSSRASLDQARFQVRQEGVTPHQQRRLGRHIDEEALLLASVDDDRHRVFVADNVTVAVNGWVHHANLRAGDWKLDTRYSLPTTMYSIFSLPQFNLPLACNSNRFTIVRQKARLETALYAGFSAQSVSSTPGPGELSFDFEHFAEGNK